MVEYSFSLSLHLYTLTAISHDKFYFL